MNISYVELNPLSINTLQELQTIHTFVTIAKKFDWSLTWTSMRIFFLQFSSVQRNEQYSAGKLYFLIFYINRKIQLMESFFSNFKLLLGEKN